jgi:protein-L-isoaspartate(D-aspartate) O-methyltransferase
MPRLDRPRVLLLWPGGVLGGEGNFGVPQLLSIAAAVRRSADAIVDVVDLDLERALGPVDLRAIARRGYDLVGVSCYSSYDYLKVVEIGDAIRAELPRAWIVTGGYHPSARPDDFTIRGLPFDFVVVGDGELPMARLAEALVTGRRPLARVLGPEPVAHPDEADPYDWTLLDRYRGAAREVASQAEIYLSRGCPYDCAFCMERAKRDVSWRALEPGRAVEEMHRLDRFLDLSSWTLFIADALFGMKRAWRRAFLEELCRRPIRARKIWVLIRLDLVEREDLALMARANVAPGFGLESGDPDMLRTIRKAGKLDEHLDRMMDVAGWAHELGVPFGANVIVGHPGETEASMRKSAAFLERLFLGDPRGTMGFLSVDPFRLYPGSPIDEELEDWQKRTGVRVRRYPWWIDGDQGFLSEWVDPSASLSFLRALDLKRRLFDPILRAIPARFAYQGPARDYFVRAIDEQVALTSDRQRLATLGLFHLWRQLTGAEVEDAPVTLSADVELARAARGARREVLAAAGISLSTPIGLALVEVPRERFARLDDVATSADDVPLPLDDHWTSAVSALHAYAAAFSALDLRPGDALVDLGGGTGYGAAVAAAVVGPGGRVLTVEIDADLSHAARTNLAATPHVEVVHGSAHDTDRWRGAHKVYAGFAQPEIPQAWIDALAEGGVLVAPVGTAAEQTLVRVTRTAGGAVTEALGRVLYVGDRTLAPWAAAARRREGGSGLATPDGYAASGNETAASPKETAASPKETAASGKETAAAGKETAAAGEETAASPKETAASGKETAASGKETAASPKETAASPKEAAASGKETAASGKETAASGKETAASGKETAASGKETAASGKETAASGKETAASSGIS